MKTGQRHRKHGTTVRVKRRNSAKVLRKKSAATKRRGCVSENSDPIIDAIARRVRWSGKKVAKTSTEILQSTSTQLAVDETGSKNDQRRILHLSEMISAESLGELEEDTPAPLFRENTVEPKKISAESVMDETRLKKDTSLNTVLEPETLSMESVGELKEDTPASLVRENAVQRPSYIPENAWHTMSDQTREEVVHGIDRHLGKERIGTEIERAKAQESSVCYSDIVIIKRGFTANDSEMSELILCRKKGNEMEESLHVLPCMGVNSQEPIFITECLFRVLPALDYDSIDDGLSSDKKQAINQRHEFRCAEIIRDWCGKAVQFGHTVQLQHVLSGKFITLESTDLAAHDKSMLKVHLAAGSEDSRLKLKPRDYARRDGDELDSVYDAIMQFTSGDAILDFSDRMAGGSIIEKHTGALQQASWVLSTYSGHAEEALTSSLRYSEVVSLYFPELRRYLTITPTSELISEDHDLNDLTSLKEQVHELEQRLNAKNDKQVVALVSNPDSAHAHGKNLIRCMWVLEHERPDRGGAVYWSRTRRDDAVGRGNDDSDIVEHGKVRLRHLFSAQYLSIDEAGTAKATPRRSEATLLLIKPVSFAVALKLREQPNEPGDAVESNSLVYLMNGGQTICAGGKCSLQERKEDVKSKAGPFTLEQCETICGPCWSELVRGSLCAIAQKKQNKKQITIDELRSVACRFGFSHKLEDVHSARAALHVTQARGSLSAAFQITQLSRDVGNTIRMCQELVRRVGSLRVTLHEGTDSKYYKQWHSELQAISSYEEESLLSISGPCAQELKLQSRVMRILSQDVANAATAMVFYAVQLQDSIIADITEMAKIKTLLRKLVKLEHEHELRTVSYRQLQLKNMGAFEILFDLLTVFALGARAEASLHSYETKNTYSMRHKIRKYKSAKLARKLRTHIKFLDQQMKMAKEYHISEKCPCMQDAQNVLNFLQNDKSGNSTPPKITRVHYKEICRVLYKFICILCKSNSASARYCFRYSHIMLQHFSLDIGVADAFTVVVDNNYDLLQNHLTKDHINKYVELLSHGMMNPEHLKHLQRFCAYKSTPISRVQVLICELYFDAARKHGTCMLETVTHDDEHADRVFAEREKYENEIQFFHAPAKTQAMHIIREGPLALYVVYKNREIRLSSTKLGDEHNERKGSRSEPHRRIAKAQKIYNYYCQQLELFCCMARGRNYVAIESITKIMKFDIVLSGMLDKSLPTRLRALFAKLMNCIYVNVEPFYKMHLPVLTRAPNFEVEDSYLAVASEHFEDAGQSQQQLAEAKNNEAEAYRTRENFAILQAFVSLYLQSVATRDKTPHLGAKAYAADPDSDELTCQVTSLCAYLVDFGFFKREHFVKLCGVIMDHLAVQIATCKNYLGNNIQHQHIPSKQDSTATRLKKQTNKTAIHPSTDSNLPGKVSQPSTMIRRGISSRLLKKFQSITGQQKNKDSYLYRLTLLWYRLKFIIIFSRTYAFVMMGLIILSILVGFSRAGVLIYLQTFSVSDDSRTSFERLFFSFSYSLYHLPISFVVAFPLLCILWADTLMHFSLQGKDVDKALLSVKRLPEPMCTWILESISIAFDILDILVLFFSSRLLISPVQWSTPYQRYGWTAVLFLAPIFRCFRFIRHRHVLKQYNDRTSTHKFKLYKPGKEVQMYLKQFDRDSLAHELSRSEYQPMQVQPSQTGKVLSEAWTQSLQLQLRLLTRLSMLHQEEVLNDFGKPFLTSKPDTIATQTQKYDSRLFRKNKEQTGLVLLELCIYPDSEVASRAYDLIERTSNFHRDLFTLMKRVHIVTANTNSRHRKLIEILRKMSLLVEAFEQWGCLADPQCEPNFNKMTKYLKDIVRVLTDYKTGFKPAPVKKKKKFLTPAQRIQAVKQQKSHHAGPSKIAELRDKRIPQSMQRTVLEHDGVAIATKILGLLHEWYGNYGMVGRIADVFSRSIHEDAITESLGRNLMTQMLEALNQVLFCVIRGYRPAQKECFPLVTLLLPLMGKVNGCNDVIKEILVHNRQVAKQLSDEDIATMVHLLRISAPRSLLDKIEHKATNSSRHESLLLRGNEIDLLEETLENEHQQIASLVTELLIFIILDCDDVRMNQRRVLDILMRETVPTAEGWTHRLQLEVDMMHVNDKEYQVAMEHTDWISSPKLSYHLCIMKIMAICCTSEREATNINEVKCQSMIDFESLMFFVSQDYVSYQVKAHLLMLFYNAAADVQVGIQFLCNSPQMKTLFRMFKGMLEHCCNTMDMKRGSLWFKNVLEQRYPWPHSPKSMLCLNKCKTFFRNINGRKVPYLQDGDLMVFVVVVVCPILVSLFKCYNKEIYDYVLRKVTLASTTSSNDFDGSKTRYSGSETVQENANNVNLDGFVPLALNFVKKVQGSLNEGRIMKLDQSRHLNSLMQQLERVLPEYYKWADSARLVTPIMPSIATLLSKTQDMKQEEFSRKIQDEVINAFKQFNMREPVPAATRSMYEFLKRGSASYNYGAKVLFLSMCHVVSRVGEGGKFSARLKNRHDLGITIRVINHMRDLQHLVRDSVDGKNPGIVRAKEILKSISTGVGNYTAEEKQDAENRLEEWRLSAKYNESTMMCVPQDLELGLAEFIVILVRKGLPMELRRCAMEFFAFALLTFPGQRQSFQEKIANVLRSESYNMNCCYFFAGIADVFRRGEKALQECTNRSQFTEEAEFEEQQMHIEETCIALEFMRSLCEGHFFLVQDQLTHQPNSRRSVNILRWTIRLLDTLFRCYQEAEMTLVQTQNLAISIINFLTESTQGPCQRNQDWLLGNGLLALCNKLLNRMRKDITKEWFLRDLEVSNNGKSTRQSRVDPDLEILLTANKNVAADKQAAAREKIEELEVAICLLVMALVEGADESRKLDRVLQQFKPTLRKLFQRSDLWNQVHLSATERDPRRQKYINTLVVLLRTLANHRACSQKACRWMMQLTAEPPKNQVRACTPAELRVWMGYPKYIYGSNSSDDEIKPLVESVEICWYFDDDSPARLLPIFFPSPKSFDLIRKSTLDEIVNELPAGDQAKKLKKLIESFEHLLQEVAHMKWLRSNKAQCYTRLLASATDLLATTYFVVCVLLNLFLLFSLVRVDSGYGSPSSFEFELEPSRTYKTGTHYQFNILHILDWVPERMKGLPYFSWIMSHAIKSDRRNVMVLSESIYLGLMWLQVILSLKKFVYRLIVDLVPWYRREKGDLRKLCQYHLLIYIFELTVVIVSASSYFWLFLNPLLLIKECVIRYKVPNIVIEAICGTRGNRSSFMLLGTTFLLLVLICALIAMIIFSYGHNDIPDDPGVCESYWSCVLFMTNVGLRNGGGVGESIATYTLDEHKYTWLTYLVFHFLTFFIVNMVLLNVVFGIIIDTFGMRRDNELEIETDRDTRCTICGLVMKDFQKLGKGIFKELHVKFEHNRWSYFKYWLYLVERDHNEFTGAEQYVWDLLQSRNISDRIKWIPSERARRLENLEEKKSLFE